MVKHTHTLVLTCLTVHMLALGLIQASVHVGQKVHIKMTGLKRFMVHIKKMGLIRDMVHI